MLPRWDDLRKRLETSKEIRDFLKKKLKMHTSEIRDEISKIIRLMQNDRIPKYLDKLERYIQELELKNPTRADLFKLILEVIKNEEDKFGLPEHLPAGESIDEEEIKERAEEQSGIIGRVVISKTTPATPYTFSFWIKYDNECHLQPGDMVKVRLGKDKCVAVVEKVEAVSDIPDPITAYYSWSYGEPTQEMPTAKPIIRKCDARVVFRSDQKHVPFIEPHEVYLSEADEIEEALNSQIEEKHRVLIGFTRDAFGTMVPVFGDFRYLFGYRAGHINISGKSGVAGKTSYALFLIASALSTAKKLGSESYSLACIAFNVKERDLLTVKDFPYRDMKEAIELLSKESELELDARMWEKAYDLGIDPIEIFSNAEIFQPGVSAEPTKYHFGLQDILNAGVDVFMCMFNPEDIDDKMESLIYSIEVVYRDGKTTFDQLINDLTIQINRSQRQHISIGGVPHHVSTIGKFLNRLNKILRSLSNCITRSQPKGHPIEIEKLEDGDLYIIDIKPLADNGKRMVFLYIMKRLDEMLEAKKEGVPSIRIGSTEVDLELFPSRVAVFVDELNKFAPSGRSKSPIKSSIIDIVARGRSIGLTLIGAEQLASQLDEEILVNTSTYLVGKQENVELTNKFYKWISEGLKDRVFYLQPGELVLSHERHAAPIVIRFPRPLHRVEE